MSTTRATRTDISSTSMMICDVCMLTCHPTCSKNGAHVCDTSGLKYLSHCISEDVFLCCRKGASSTTARIIKKGVVRPRRCPHTCCGMPSYLKKIKDLAQVLHVKVWYAKHLSTRNVALRTYMHRQLCRHEKRIALSVQQYASSSRAFVFKARPSYGNLVTDTFLPRA